MRRDSYPLRAHILTARARLSTNANEEDDRDANAPQAPYGADDLPSRGRRTRSTFEIEMADLRSP